MANEEPIKNHRMPAKQKKAISKGVTNRCLQNKIKELEEQLRVDEENRKELRPDYDEFCLLYVHGGMRYTGNPGRCYQKAINNIKNPAQAKARGKDLLNKDYIQNRISQLTQENEIEKVGKKMRIEETLLKIMEEGSKASFTDRFGNKVNPAAMRNASINAARTLNDMNGFNKPQELKIGTEEEMAIQFITVAPAKKESADGTGKAEES